MKTVSKNVQQSATEVLVQCPAFMLESRTQTGFLGTLSTPKTTDSDPHPKFPVDALRKHLSGLGRRVLRGCLSFDRTVTPGHNFPVMRDAAQFDLRIDKCMKLVARRPIHAFFRGAERWQLREISGGIGFGQTPYANFGLGDATNARVFGSSGHQD
jgi:hypothetical protein